MRLWSHRNPCLQCSQQGAGKVLGSSWRTSPGFYYLGSFMGLVGGTRSQLHISALKLCWDCLVHLHSLAVVGVRAKRVSQWKAEWPFLLFFFWSHQFPGSRACKLCCMPFAGPWGMEEEEMLPGVYCCFLSCLSSCPF